MSGKVSLADLLARARENQGSLQRDVAKRLGVTQKTISLWEAGVRVPRPHRWKLVAKAYGIPFARLSDVATRPA